MSSKLTFLGDAGRNKHSQKLVRVQCSCGSPEFTCREDSFKQERTTSCGFCRKGGKRKAEQVTALQIAPPVEQPKPTPEVESKHERGTPAYFADEIASRDAAATSAENRARFLRSELAEQTSTDLDTHKRWNTETTTAHKLRQEIARLQLQKANAETATVKDERSQADIVRDKIAALKGRK